MSESAETSCGCGDAVGHVIIAGFGVPGRAIAELCDARGVEFCVIEKNPATVTRCSRGGVRIIEGDVRDPQTLRNAGLDRASLLVIAIPDERSALEATSVARALNGTVPIITRCHFISAGLDARARGANAVVVAEQVVAQELLAVGSGYVGSKAGT
jgi:voltage-gated potassium channel Kch